MDYIFEYKDKVRDYELDIQGIVNNSNYQHYLETARHEYAHSRGLNFSKLHYEGIDFVVSAIEMRFKVPLRSGDEYFVRLNVKKEGLRYFFMQDIYRASDDKICLRGKVELVCLKDGKLTDYTIKELL